MIFTLIFLVAAIGSLIYCYLSIWSKNDCIEFPQGILLIPSCILLGVSLVIWIGVYSGTLSRYAQFIAYEKAIQAEYETAIDRTEQLMIENPNEPNHVSIGLLALPLLSHSTQVAERIKEKRDLVTNYHRKYEAYKLYRSRWIFRQYMAKPPAGLFK